MRRWWRRRNDMARPRKYKQGGKVYGLYLDCAVMAGVDIKRGCAGRSDYVNGVLKENVGVQDGEGIREGQREQGQGIETVTGGRDVDQPDEADGRAVSELQVSPVQPVPVHEERLTE